MTTPHDTFREQLLDLAYGELGRGEARALRAHLETCAECRAELARMNATRSAMAELGAVPAPERGEDVLLAAAREAARERAPRPFLPPWVWGASIGAVGVAAVAILSLRLAPGLRSPTAEPDPTELAASSPPPPEPGTVDAPPPAPAPESAAPPAAQAPPVASAADEAAGERERLAGKAERLPSPKKQAPPRAQRVEEKPAVGGKAADARSEADELRRSADERDALELKSKGDLGPPGAPRAAPAPAPPPAAAAPAREPLAAAEAAPDEGAADQVARRERRAPDAGTMGRPQALGGLRESPFARHARLSRAGELRTATRAFPGCAGEASRVVESDGAGQVVKVTRRGAAAGKAFVLEQLYDEGGSLAAVRWSSDGRVHELQVGAAGPTGAVAGVPSFAFEPARAADAGLDAPPRCGG